MRAGEQAVGANTLERFRAALRLAKAPALLEELLAERALAPIFQAFEPLVGLRGFEEAADDLRGRAARVAVDLGCPLIETQLEHAGYDTDEIDEIRVQVDVFHYQDAKLLLFTSALLRALDGSCGGGRASSRALMRIPAGEPEGMPEIEQVPEDVDGKLGRCFADIREHLKLERVPDDFLALGRWPKYLMTAWADARRRDDEQRAREAIEDLCVQADAAAEQFPLRVAVTAESLRAAGADPVKVRALVHRHRAALSSLVLDLALFKVQLDGAEDAVDSPFPIDWEYLSNDDYLPDDVDEELKLRAGDPTSLDDASTKVAVRR